MNRFCKVVSDQSPERKLQLGDISAIVVVILSCVGLGVGTLCFRPDLTYNSSYVLHESGNQLYRAQQLAQGKLLYRDLGMQYGPLATYLYTGLTVFAGNTVATNWSWHLGLSIVPIVLEFVLLRRYMRRTVALFGVLCLAMPAMLAPGGVVGVYTNFEHLSFERVYILVLMLLWRPPSMRSLNRDLVLGGVLGLWQLTKFGGAFFAMAALISVDVVYSCSCKSAKAKPSTVRCIRSLANVLWGLALVEGLFAIWCFAFLPVNIAIDAIWPQYLVKDYKYLGLQQLLSWNGLKPLPIHQIYVMGCFGLALYGLFRWVRMAKSFDEPKSDLDQLNSLGLWIGVFFYLWGSLAYFGHLFLFLQYACFLSPAAIFGLDALRPLQRRVAFCVCTLPLLLSAKIALVDQVSDRFAPYLLPNGEQIVVSAEERCSIRALAEVSGLASEKEGFIVLQNTWAGGGVHLFFNAKYDLRNTFVGPGAFRPADIQELEKKLDRVRAYVVCDTDSEDSGVKQAINNAMGDAMAARILSEFSYDSKFSYGNYKVLVRSSPVGALNL